MRKNFTYETAQICLNGHLITAYYESSPEFRQKHCDKCGQSTIHECNECKTPIHGRYIQPNVDWSLCPLAPPSFCHECGAPYPWTKSKIEAANEYIDDLDVLTEDEKEQFKESLDEIAKNSPKGELAVNTIAKLMKKLGQGTYEVARKLIVDISSNTLKLLIESSISPKP